jgi:2-polyprenyl-3-methyl-5-hydroxy-6-metoxy-1,4-benzoquinol methylase
MAARIVVIDVISIESMFLRPTRSSWGTREFDTFDYAEILLEVDKSPPEWQIFHKKQISEISQYLAKQRVNILDVGCGAGDWLNECDKVGWSTFGIALSEGEIRAASKRTKAELAVRDINNGLPFEPCFDVITCFDVLEHLKDPKTALSVIYKKLCSSGILLFTVPRITFGFCINKRWRSVTHVSLLKITDWKTITKKAHFRITSSTKTIFFRISRSRRGLSRSLLECLKRLGSVQLFSS